MSDASVNTQEYMDAHERLALLAVEAVDRGAGPEVVEEIVARADNQWHCC